MELESFLILRLIDCFTIAKRRLKRILTQIRAYRRMRIVSDNGKADWYHKTDEYSSFWQRCAIAGWLHKAGAVRTAWNIAAPPAWARRYHCTVFPCFVSDPVFSDCQGLSNLVKWACFTLAAHAKIGATNRAWMDLIRPFLCMENNAKLHSVAGKSVQQTMRIDADCVRLWLRYSVVNDCLIFFWV